MTGTTETVELSLYDIRESLRKIVEAHHAKHGQKLTRAICVCGHSSGGLVGSEACKRFSRANDALISLEAELSRYEETDDEPTNPGTPIAVEQDT